MPEINYNNPEFAWTFSGSLSGTVGSNVPYFFVIDNNDWIVQPNGTSILGQKYQGTGTASFIITYFARQGFLIKLNVKCQCDTVVYAPTVTTPWTLSNIGFQYNLEEGTFSINNASHTGPALIPENYVCNLISDQPKIEILSYRKRFLRFDTEEIEIHENDWNNTFILRPNLTVFKYNYPNSSLKLTKCFSLISDEWTYYNTDLTSQEISSIDEFPIYKYVISDSIDVNHLIYEKTTSTSISWPVNSRGRALLKSRGSHFLFNNDNELQKRDLSLINGQTKGTSNTQTYEALHKQGTSANDYTSIYLIQQEYNQIMHKKASCNQMIQAATKGEPYKYFNDDKIGSTNVYTDLWDNNKEPTKEKPIILYNNWTQLVYNGINLLRKEIPSRFFWVDPYTLYCCNNIYFIPSNWQVSLLNMQGINVSDITATTTDIWNNLSSSSETGGIARVTVKETSLVYNSVNNPTIVCYNISHSNQYISLNQNYFNWDYYDLKSQMIYKIDLTSSYGAGFKRSTASSEEALIIGSGINPLTAVINLKAITPHFLPRISDIIDNTCLSVSSFGNHYNNSSNLQIYARQYLSSPSSNILYNYIYTQVTLYASGWNGLLYSTASPYSTSEASAWPDGTIYNINSAAYGNAYGFGSNWYTYSQVLYQLQGASNPNAYCIIAYDPNL